VKYGIFISIPVVTLFLLSCKSLQVESRWLDRAVTFNGKASEWNDLVVYPKDTRFGLAVMNDDSYVYLCMMSWDQTITAQITRMGLTTWFETKNGKGKPLGVNYPLGMAKSGVRRGMDDPEAMKDKIKESLEHIEILGPGKDDTCPTRTIITESMGIMTRIASSEGNCIYELKVPLNQDSIRKFAIDIKKDDIIMVKLETSAFDPERMKGPSSGESSGPSGGGMGGHEGGGMGGGGMHGGGGHVGGMHGGPGHGGAGSAGMSEPFKLSFSIKLAARPGAIK
jgi:uncharacterized membrane protein YgcG